MKIHFLPTVWSDAILLEKDGHFGLVDAGLNFEKFQNYLTKIGAEKFDFIILTHFHKDHYGSIADIVKAYPVERVIFKDFSGVVSSMSNGMPADDAYRADELRICAELKETIRQHSRLVMSDEIDELRWMDITFKLFYTENIMKIMYEDENSPVYHQFAFGENPNNMPIFFEYAGRNILLSGDMTDFRAKDDRVSFMNRRLAEKLNCKLDIYKASHHGHRGETPETLEIYRPDYAVITNKEVNAVDCVERLKTANPEVNIYIMSLGGRVFDIAPDGEILVSDLEGYAAPAPVNH